jgi:hypothetical protein
MFSLCSIHFRDDLDEIPDTEEEEEANICFMTKSPDT